MKVTEESWPMFAKSIATDGEPLLYSPAAMERYMKHMKRFIYHVPHQRGKFRAINNCALIDFKTEWERKFVMSAWDRYLEDCVKINKDVGDSPMAKLVAFLKFRQAAELARCETIADLLYQDVTFGGKAGVFAPCFRPTIARVVRILVRKYGVSRERISLIWGGDDSLNKTSRLSDAEIIEWMRKMASGQDIPRKIQKQIEKQLLQSQEEREEIEELKEVDLRLGNQSRIERQREIDKFQNGESLYCFFTFAAGGVGLSLHHTDKNNKGKEVSLRPRRAYLTPTYSAQEFVQGLGRAHRSIFSLSDTEQTILFYRNTIEEHVMGRVSLKLKCLRKVVAARESWTDAVWEGRSKSAEELHQIVDGEETKYLPEGDDSGTDVIDSESNEPEE